MPATAPDSAPPFRDPARRMHRPCDDRFAAYIEGRGAVAVRIIGPRRTGKTSLVVAYAARVRAPLLAVTVPPTPADASPTAVFARALDDRIAALGESSDRKTVRWYAAYRKLRQRRAGWTIDRTLTGKITASLGFAGFELGGQRTRKSNAPETPGTEGKVRALAYAATVLDLLDTAAEAVNERPVVFLDEIQHLFLASARTEADALVWSLRNAMQNHRHCRYVLAGSNRRLFDLLQVGQNAPFLHMGSALEIPTAELLCGKIGEIVPVLERLWADSRPGDVIDEGAQRAAVDQVIAATDTLDSALTDLTRTQAALLRYIVTRPGAGLYTNEAKAAIAGGSDGTISTALSALVERGFVEAYGKTEFRASAPLLALAVFSQSAPAAPEPKTGRKGR